MKHAHAGKVTEFHWARGRLFDYHIAVVLYQMCLEEPVATVTKVSLLLHACMHA
jgi:DNA topoisomerase III